jgi:RNA polymerase sigma factor (TIGR02999 family)
MRTILVDAARRRRTERHGGAHVRVPFDEATPSPDGTGEPGVDVLALDQALDRLEALDPRGAEVVRLRFFAGAEVEEIARMLDVSARTVKRDWRAARLWLYEAIGEGR